MAYWSNEALVILAFLLTAAISFFLKISAAQSILVFLLLWPSLGLLRSRARWREINHGDPMLRPAEFSNDEMSTGRLWHLYQAHKEYAETTTRDGAN
jgi:hypothetical protein